ncbi:hypothetical protein SAMN04488057_107202 [Cyclobacterium lianum]|uniref:Tetratricopeptide repeat protein n=1 Tax=Cyclobacterium lianum TaxID=388280 RepID=A0A1M7P9V9_9BACT|nr:hypothetical protein [Cyclobacterium lianum]SHN13538.1 hypothetical protein SAMN04488057_107202 [Cyclobacterium lianum]
MALNSQELISLLLKAGQLDKEDFKNSLKLQEEFPYFLIPKVLGARYEWNHSGSASNTLLHWAAVLSPDRKRLKTLVTEEMISPDITGKDDDTSDAAQNVAEETIPEEKEQDISEQIDQSWDAGERDAPENTDKPERSVKPNRDEILRRLEENLNRIKKKDSGQEHPGGQEKKKEETGPSTENDGEDLVSGIARKESLAQTDQRKKEQLDMINNFQERPIRLSPEQMDQENNLPDLSEKSTVLNDNMLSESFARLLVKQNKKPEAIEIYRKLILKFPQKKTYFADQIEQLKA